MVLSVQKRVKVPIIPRTNTNAAAEFRSSVCIKPFARSIS